LNLQRSSACSI